MCTLNLALEHGFPYLFHWHQWTENIQQKDSSSILSFQFLQDEKNYTAFLLSGRLLKQTNKQVRMSGILKLFEVSSNQKVKAVFIHMPDVSSFHLCFQIEEVWCHSYYFDINLQNHLLSSGTSTNVDYVCT